MCTYEHVFVHDVYAFDFCTLLFEVDFMKINEIYNLKPLGI